MLSICPGQVATPEDEERYVALDVISSNQLAAAQLGDAWHSSADSVEEFARNDPYVQNGLVTEWSVRRWKMVMGDGAEPPG